MYLTVEQSQLVPLLSPKSKLGPSDLPEISKELCAAPLSMKSKESGPDPPNAPSAHSLDYAAYRHRAWGWARPACHQLYISLLCSGHTVSDWHQEQSPWLGRPPRRGYISGPEHHRALQIQASTTQALHTSSTLQASVFELSQGCFLDGGWGRRWANQMLLVELQRVRGLSWSIMQTAHPQIFWVSKKKKQTPSWVVLPQMAPQNPRKENKGSNPHFASASGEHKAQGC